MQTGIIVAGIMFGDFGALLEGFGPYLDTIEVARAYAEYEQKVRNSENASLQDTVDTLNLYASTLGPDEAKLASQVSAIYKANWCEEFPDDGCR